MLILEEQKTMLKKFLGEIHIFFSSKVLLNEINKPWIRSILSAGIYGKSVPISSASALHSK